MNLKKFISAVSAFAVTAGLAVTASATSLDNITTAGTTKQYISVGSFDADYRLEYNSNIYVPDGGKVDIYYTKDGNSAVGPHFILDATAADGTVWVYKNDSKNGNEKINKKYDFFSSYNAGHTVHVKIETAVSSSNKIGNSTITLSAYNKDDSAFFVTNTKRRYPSNNSDGGVPITGRNLNEKGGFSVIATTITGEATVKDATIVKEKIAATVNAEEVESYSNDNGAAVYQATVTNDSVNALSNIKATAEYKYTDKDGKEINATKESEAATFDTAIAPGSAAAIAVVVENKTADEIDSLKVRLY